MAVQFCGTCGHPLIPDQLFCQHCGSRADENATRGAPPVTPGIPVSSGGTLYCGECGALVGSQDRVCRRCGALVEPSAGPVSDPSLSDAPTMRGTPPPPAFQPAPAFQAPPAFQPAPAFQAPPPAYQAPPTPGIPQTPPPGYPAQPPSGWGASYTPNPYTDSPTFTLGSSGPAVQAPPYRPTGPGGPPPGEGQRWPLVLGLVLVALILIVGGGVVLAFHPFSGKPQTNGPTPTATTGITPTPGVTVTPSPTAVVLNTNTARALITLFYNDINAKQYDAAYDLLSQEWMARQSRQNFDSGFSNTIQDTISIVSAEQASDGIEVDITLQAQQTTGITNYAGYYIVTIENGKLVILRAKVNQT